MVCNIHKSRNSYKHMQIVISPKYQVSYDFVLQIPIIFNVEGETVYQGRMCVPSINTAAGVSAPALPASFNIH